MEKRERKLAAIMLTDIVGFSKKMGANEEVALRMLERHNEVLTAIIKEFQGNVLKFMGDAILAEFPSVVEAVRCAVKIQGRLKKDNETLPEEENIVIRIGIHVGDVVVAGGDIFGDGVNIAARIQPLAEPGGINITSTVYNQVKNIAGLEAVSLGQKSLKNIKDPVEILKIPLGGSVAGTASAGRRGFSKKGLRFLLAGTVIVLVFAGGQFYNKRVQPRKKFEEGKRLVVAGELDRAVTVFSRAIRARPGNPQFRFGRGMAYSQKGDTPKALSDFEAACAGGMAAGCEAAESLRNRPAPALRAPEPVVATSKAATPSIGPFLRTGEEALARRDWSAAEGAFGKALALSPTNPEALAGRGFVAFSRKDFRGAVKSLDRAVAEGSRDPEVYARLGFARAQTGKPAEGRKDLAQAIRLDPSFALSYRFRGNISREQNDDQAALEDFEKACTLGDRYSCRMVVKIQGR